MAHDYDDDHARALAEQLIRGDKEYKEYVCANGPNDIPKRVIWLTPGDEKANMIVSAFFGEPPDLVPADEIALVAQAAHDRFGSPWLIAFLAEAYVQTYDEHDEIPHQRGTLTEKFLSGDPNAIEALTIILIHKRRDGSFRTISAQTPFRYADGGIEWSETRWFDTLVDGESSEGALADAMIAAFGGEHN